MSNTLFISDLHFSHNRILHFSPDRLGQKVSCIEEHDELLVERWNSMVQKRDLVWVLGDVCFNKHSLPILHRLKGQKHLVMGNHDTFGWQEYTKYFRQIYGAVKRYKCFLTHVPIHRDEMRGCYNVHGHVHDLDKNLVLRDDPRYISVTVEALKGVPMSIGEIRERFEKAL